MNKIYHDMLQGVFCHSYYVCYQIIQMRLAQFYVNHKIILFI